MLLELILPENLPRSLLLSPLPVHVTTLHPDITLCTLRRPLQ